MSLGVHTNEAGESLKSWVKSGIISSLESQSQGSSEILGEDVDMKIDEDMPY